MTLNFTLIIQAINFGVAYWLLRTFIFKPIVADLTHQEQQDAAYKERISLLEFDVEQAHKKLALEHAGMKRELASWYPTDQSVHVFSFDELQLKTERLKPSEHEKIEFQKKLFDALRVKVML
jgi:hypothetical protein